MALVRNAIVITWRELEVLDELLRDGADNITIGARLGMAEDTVKAHLAHLYRKTGKDNRTALAVAVTRNQINLATLAPGQIRLVRNPVEREPGEPAA